MSKKYRESQKVAAPVAAPEPQGLPDKVDAVVALDVYAKITGKKSDQIAGFAYWAKRTGWSKLTVSQWNEQWAAFQRRPV